MTERSGPDDNRRMTLRVRPLDEADWKTLREIRLRALLDAPGSFYGTYQESVALTEDDWRARLAGTDRVILLAELDDRPVGMISGAPTSEDERDPGAALMLAMWVEPESRGHGAADALTDALLKWSREQGYERLLLWVYDAAPRAAAFYRRAGFVATGRVEVFHDPSRPLSLMSQALSHVAPAASLQAPAEDPFGMDPDDLAAEAGPRRLDVVEGLGPAADLDAADRPAPIGRDVVDDQ
jgi:GNAT superfamily N-acetyltransferase